MSKEATVGELIQINEDGPVNWFRCILVVDEVKPWGVRAYCTVPQASGEPSRDAYRLLRLITVLIWSVAVIGVAAWVWGDRKATARSITTTGPQSPIVTDTKGDVRIDFNAPPEAPR